MRERLLLFPLALSAVLLAGCDDSSATPDDVDSTSEAGAAGDSGVCSSSADCPPPLEDCMVALCLDAHCGAGPAPQGATSAAEVAGDCRAVLCDGQGGRVVEDDPGDVFDDGNPCTDDSCVARAPVNQPSLEGSVCSQGACDGDGHCVECLLAAECSSGICDFGRCLAATCFDGVRNVDETDVDCGAACVRCEVGQLCQVHADCAQGFCDPVQLTCVAASCSDGVRDGTETDVDCGLGCAGCSPGQGCLVDGDCSSGKCSGAVCLPTCSDQLTNALETDTDCGGVDCAPCDVDKACLVGADCATAVCAGSPKLCQAASCSDGVENGPETDVDCGGGCVNACAPGAGCKVDGDCIGGQCTSGSCVPTCTDGVLNGTESDVDCGGLCDGCPSDKGCDTCWDCGFGLKCASGVCAAATCPAGFMECDGDYCGSACETATICPAGFTDCDSDICTNGCETKTDDDPQNCGACGTQCAVDQVCARGGCYKIWTRVAGDGWGDEARALVRDDDGNVYVTGYYSGYFNFDGYELYGDGTEDMFVTKFDALGTPLWSEGFGVSGNQRGLAIALDDLGNVYVAGSNDGAIDFGQGQIYAVSASDSFLAKLDADGTPLWGYGYASDMAQSVSALAVDSSRNVILVGGFQGSVDFGAGDLTSAGNTDVFVVKFDTDGVFQWNKQFGDVSSQTATGVDVDPDDNIVVCGTFFGSVDFGGGGVTSAGFADVFLLELAANGDWVWNETFGDANPQGVSWVDVDDQGRIALTGTFKGTVDFGSGSLSSTAANAAYVATYDAQGSGVWSARLTDTGGGVATGGRVVLRPDGGAVVTGRFSKKISFGTSNGLTDIFVAKFDGSGTLLPSQTYGSTGNDIASGLAIDAEGYSYVAGGYSAEIDFGVGPAYYSGGGFDAFVAKVVP